MNLTYTRFSWLLLVLLWVNSSGQTGNLPEWVSVRERVSLHTDRDLYFAGEPLWFSAHYFATAGRDDRQISQVLYVELIDLQSKGPVVQKKFKIRDSRVSGNLLIPPGISSGTYLLRAYTLYMRNFPSVEFANHFITVLNPALPAPTGMTSTSGTNLSERFETRPGRIVYNRKLEAHRGDTLVANANALVFGMHVETQSDGRFLHVNLTGSNPNTNLTRGPLRLQIFSKDFRVLAEKEIPWSVGQDGSSVPAGDVNPGTHNNEHNADNSVKAGDFGSGINGNNTSISLPDGGLDSGSGNGDQSTGIIVPAADVGTGNKDAANQARTSFLPGDLDARSGNGDQSTGISVSAADVGTGNKDAANQARTSVLSDVLDTRSGNGNQSTGITVPAADLGRGNINSANQAGTSFLSDVLDARSGNGNHNTGITVPVADVGTGNKDEFSKVGISIPSGELSPGINYMVIASPEGETLAIHAYYQPEYQVREIQIETTGSEFKPRDLVKANYKAPGDQGELVLDISVVIKGTRMADRPHIPEGYLTDPLLVEDYIRSHPQISREEITNILAAHVRTVDPTRFDHPGAFSYPEIPAFIPEIRDLTVSGIFRNKATLEPIPDQEVFVSVLFNNPQLHISRTDKDGQFLFSLNNLQGINDIFITPETGINDDDGRELLIRVPFSPDIPLMGPAPFALDSTHQDLVEIMYANFQVMERFHAQSDSLAKKRDRTGTFNIDGEKTTILSDDYIALESLREIFSEIVPNAKIRRNGDRFSIIVTDQDGNVFPGKPLVLIDHVPVFNINALLDVPVSEIVKVEVINKTFILGSNSINGIVMITTKSNNYGELNFGSPSIFLELPALEEPREDGFPSEKLPDSLPDFRTTLYWNTHSLLNGNEGSFEFTASDRRGVYTIIVRGYAPDGTYHYGTLDIVIR